ncbi:hypothetical protein QJS83_15485 [Bdellovibrio sp. 22V]|uniref:hypothetical protein n=1 Tax=Bdellovibrio TaxID=958 RepID=UPI002543A5C0|nr:hypothetical protein [Bdellovibrio sp. 22V]WII71866.1 hypothetical protein QJS83_15485 [Bdellovibrio sp. 22V]
MSSKLLSLTIAGIMGLQSAAMAQTDRTAGIGDEQIKNAKINMQAFKAELVTLDQALLAAKESILKRDSKGSILNGTAITGAALGLGLTTYSYFAFRSRSSGAGILGLFAGAASVLATLGSSGTSVASKAVKGDLDLKDFEAKLNAAEAEVNEAVTTATDKSASALLERLQNDLAQVRVALVKYEASDDSHAKDMLIAQLTQAAGAAITVYGVTQHNSKATLIGPLVMSAGNLGQIIRGLSDSEAKLIVNQIDQTRTSLNTLALTLE